MADVNKPMATVMGNAADMLVAARALEAQEAAQVINTLNEYGLGAGQNLPNHSTSMRGRGAFVRPLPTFDQLPTFRTKQEAYRFAAWLLILSDSHLPNEPGDHTFEQVTEAIKSV